MFYPLNYRGKGCAALAGAQGGGYGRGRSGFKRPFDGVSYLLPHSQCAPAYSSSPGSSGVFSVSGSAAALGRSETLGSGVTAPGSIETLGSGAAPRGSRVTSSTIAAVNRPTMTITTGTISPGQ